MHLQTASPAGWPQAGLSLWGAVPLWARGLQKAGLHPPLGVTASPAPSHRRLGLYLPPLPQLLGDFGAPLQLLLLLPPSMSLTEGVFCLFFFFPVLSPSSICFQRCCWADGQGRGLSAHLAQGSEKGKLQASGDQLQYCTSWLVARGCVQ